MSDEPSKFMTVKEVMDYLGVARSTIDLYARQGRLKRFKSMGRTLYLRSQVERIREPHPKN